MVMTKIDRLALLLTIGLAPLAGCGGGASTPTTPTPGAPTIPLSSACATLAPSLTGTTAIVNGADCSTPTAAVVLLNLKDADGQQVGSCSGTIISPRAILTAAHCLPATTTAVKMFLGSGPQLTAQSFARDPNYRESDPTTVDVGVVLFADDIGRAPIPLLLSRDARVGETAIIAGWGKDANGNLATLRAGVAVVTAVSSLILQTEFTSTASSVCQGDSGGPILLSEGGVWSIGGIISANSTLACSFGSNFYASIRNAEITSFVIGQVPDASRR